MKSALTLCILLLLVSPFTIKATGQGVNLFDNTRIHRVDFTSLNPADWDSIARRYLRKQYTPLKVEIDGIVMDSTGVRIKGNGFSEYYYDNKYQPFRLKFNEFRQGQKFDGLKQVNLHSHNLIEAFTGFNIWRTYGMVAPRTSFAELWFDGVFIGLYLLVDEVEKVFLDWNYGNDGGNLFKADAKGANLSWLGTDPAAYNCYQLETNETENNRSDLIAFLNSVYNTADSHLLDSVNKYLNVTSFLKSVAIEVFICKTDAFYDSGHNYFLYHNTTTGRFEYISWDLDASMANYNRFDFNLYNGYYSIDNPMINQILKHPGFKQLYYSTACEFIHSRAADKSRINALLNDAESLLRTRNLTLNLPNAKTVEEVKTFFADRETDLEKSLTRYQFHCEGSMNIDYIALENQVNIYPNPAGDFVVVEMNEEDAGEIHIVSMVGKTVLSLKPESRICRIPVGDLLPGIWLMRIQAQGNVINRKFVIK